MWEEISQEFKNYPYQKKVALFLLSKGLRVNKEAKICLEKIEIPHVKIARVLQIDRRVVDATAKRIKDREKLFRIFSNLDTIPFLKNVALHIGLNVLIVTPQDASKPGIMGNVTSKLAKEGIPIRQAIADDPYLTENPKLTIITDIEIRGEVLNELKRIEGVKELTIF